MSCAKHSSLVAGCRDCMLAALQALRQKGPVWCQTCGYAPCQCRRFRQVNWHMQCPNCHYPHGACQCGAPSVNQQYYSHLCARCNQPHKQCVCNWAPGQPVQVTPQPQPSALNQHLATREMVEELNQKIDAIALSLATLIEALSLDESKLALLKLLKELK